MATEMAENGRDRADTPRTGCSPAVEWRLVGGQGLDSIVSYSGGVVSSPGRPSPLGI